MGSPEVVMASAEDKASRPWLEELFVRMDRNGDGQLSKQELKGYLEADPEVAAKLKLPPRMSLMSSKWQAQFEAVVKGMDADASGTVGWAEFCAYFEIEKGGEVPGIQADVVPETVSLPWLRELFVRMDKNGDGLLDRAEMLKYLQGSEDELSLFMHLPPKFKLGSTSHEKFEKAFQDMSKGDGQVSWDAMCEYFGVNPSDASLVGLERDIKTPDLEGGKPKSRASTRPDSVLSFHPPPVNGMPRCQTPALQTRAVTPILSEQEFRDGKWQEKLCGNHSLNFRSGNEYQGQFGYGVYHGSGKLTEPDGSVYEGEWFEGKRNGKGKQTWANGQVYDGEWEDDKRSGTGTMTHPDGDTHQGQWRNHKREGKGKRVYATGNTYEGNWEADMKVGKGTLTWVDGDRYEGQWSADKMHGTGVFKSSKGQVFSGMFRGGRFVKRMLDLQQQLGPEKAADKK